MRDKLLECKTVPAVTMYAPASPSMWTGVCGHHDIAIAFYASKLAGPKREQALLTPKRGHNRFVFLSISTTHRPATDLGYLLHKNPSRAQSAEMSFGKAHVFYPEANEERCTGAVVIEVDPVALVRGRQGPSGEGGLFDHYVNDRPYAASSFMSSAIVELFGTAMNGRSKERPDLAATPIPFEVHIAALPCKGGEPFLRSLFEPLGYELLARRLPLDERFPEWGESRYFDVTLKATMRLAELLTHLYVLIPVLDDEKHYWIDQGEIDKLLTRGQSWLPGHPEREEITRRYLRHQKHLTREALSRLSSADDDPEPDEREAEAAIREEKVERPLSLHDIRLKTVHDKLKELGAKRVLDLGCGEGRLTRMLMNDLFIEEIVAMDVSVAALEKASRRLKLDRQPERVANRVKLLHGSLLYRDKRLEGYDAATVVEVIEHMDPPRLASFERIAFEFAKLKNVIVTTPNREYNALFETLPEGELRHKDHRFEWTRAEFEAWATGVAGRFGYTVELSPLGPVDEIHGAPSQMAVFSQVAPG